MLAYLSAGELAERMRRKELRATEAVDAFVARVEERDPAINAVVSLDVERARRLARRRDDSTPEPGPLHGVPMTIKDAFDVEGLRTTIGTPVFDRVAERSSTVARRLEDAGAIIVGHSNVPPFLADHVTENEIFGRTNNPWAPDHTPGGSSGGAAAALAAGITPVEAGSDLAGSLRLPAHYCGVYGLKCTEQRVPMTGFFTPPGGGPRPVRVMAALGPLARDLDDLDLMLRVIAGPDGVDVDVPPVPLAARRHGGRKGPFLTPERWEGALPSAPADLRATRLAVVPALPGVRVAAGVRDRLSGIAAAAADAGARVDDALPTVDFGQLTAAGDLIGSISQIFTPAAAALREEQRSLAWYLRVLDQRDRFTAAFEAFFADHDALVLPAGTTAAPPHDARAADPGPLLVFANFAGLPVLTAPAGTGADGLPIGVQIVGPRWSETRLLDIAAALEAAGVLPGFQRPPGC